MDPEDNKEEQTEQNIDTPQVTQSANDLPPESNNKKKLNRTLLIILAIVIAAGLVGIGIVIGNQNKKKATVVESVTTNTAKKTTGPSTKNDTFYMTPKDLPDLNFFKDPTQQGIISAANVKYAQIGVTAKNQPIVVVYDQSDGEASYSYISIETSSGNYEILTGPSDISSDQLNSFSKNLNSNVTLDLVDTISELNFPSVVNVDNQGFELPNYSSGNFIHGLDNIESADQPHAADISSSQIKKIGQSNQVTFYEVTSTIQSDYSVKDIFGVIGGVYATPYIPVDSLISTSNSPANITWTSGTNPTDGYSYGAKGCGDPNGYMTANGITSSDLTKAGTGPHGISLYTVPTSSALFNDFYGDAQSENSYLQSDVQNLSADAYQNIHGMFLAKNALGEYVVYEDNDFIMGGCGKPVIYLYPSVPTNVNVKVGAIVKKSSPTYTSNGWQNVKAYPSGSLMYQGKSYDSLFWEGTGFGTYPSMNSGFVVPQKRLDSSVRDQLYQQGLNTKEINDFMTFWAPRLPKSPYVRLTWFDTEQMNELAPLDIAPKPDTVIRVFLDYQALSKPESITPEILHTNPRIGFTVVEWGGLL